MTASISIAKNKLNTDLTVSTTKYIFRKEKVSTKAAENYTHIEVYTARFDAAHSARGGLYIFYVIVEHKQQLRHYARHVYINQDVNGFAYKYNGI